MAQSASDTKNDQSTLPSADLGANEWLVEEMREQYDADPGSVGPGVEALLREQRVAGQRSRTPAGRPPTAPSRAAEQKQPRPSRPSEAGRAEAARAEAGRAEACRRRRQPASEAKARPADAGPEGHPASGGRGGGAGHAARPRPVAKDVPASAPTHRARRADVHRAARRSGPHRAEHGRLAGGADRDLGALGAGQAALGQPHRHQQPPLPRPRRQGVVHPPDRLRAGQGAARDAGDERRLRRRSRASRR